MNRIKAFLRNRKPALVHLAGAILVFFIWRLCGLPSPGLLGRLIPLSWFITAVVAEKGRVRNSTLFLLTVFVLLTLFWTSGPALVTAAASAGFLGIFPELLRVSRRKYGILLAMMPLVPMVLVLVPFTGDEPHYASITEDLAPLGESTFDLYSSQAGDPTGDVTHHQRFFPALMVPGYFLGQSGLRIMNFIFALAALVLLSRLLKEHRIERWRELTVLAMLLVPGSSVLGLVYPAWIALAVFLGTVLLSETRRSTLWVLAASAVLVLIKLRFAGLAAGLVAAHLVSVSRKKRTRLLLAVTALGAAGILADLLLLGGRVFWVRYGNVEFIHTLVMQPVYRSGQLALSAASVLVDQEGGLLWKAPWVIAALAGLWELRRKHRHLFLWLGLPALLYLAGLLYWAVDNWHGMPTPAGRMLLPLLPVLIASLGCSMKRRGTGILIWISLAVSAVYFTWPALRFNHADGSDVLLTRFFGTRSGLVRWLPSAVRPDIPVFAAAIAVCAALVWMIRKNWRYTVHFAASFLVLFCFLGGYEDQHWEAEDIPSEFRNYCAVYPRGEDLEARKYWLFSRERMLLLSRPEDAVRLPLAPVENDSVEVTLIYRSFGGGDEGGLAVSCGTSADTVFGESPLQDPPGWLAVKGRTSVPAEPENAAPVRHEIRLRRMNDTLRIHATGFPPDEEAGIYLDRIEID